jgi:hypothetical protein
MNVVLVQCGSAKLAKPARAEDLYTGGLFRAARAAARRIGDRWFILSAKHGLVAPHRILAPYDQKLPSGGDTEWSTALHAALVKEGIAYRQIGDRLVVLAGEDYCVGWAALVGAELPLKGVSGIGNRINILKGLR